MVLPGVRRYGSAPYTVAVLHGGPGAAGEVRPVAMELSEWFGVVEPLQSALSVNGQVEELRHVLTKHADPPAVLVGYSWGAWLGYLVASRYPTMVSKLILVSSGAFDARYAEGLMDTRLARLTPEERGRVRELLAVMEGTHGEATDEVLGEFGHLMSKADIYERVAARTEPAEPEAEPGEVRMDIYRGVWPEAAELRRTGALVELGKAIACPVTAIHGAYDPTPAEGVRGPLSAVVGDFRFVLLDRCGHTPWVERYAATRFYEVLRGEIEGAAG